MASGTGIIIGTAVLNKLIELAIQQYAQAGTIPTYEDLEAANLLTGLKIQKLMEE